MVIRWTKIRLNYILARYYGSNSFAIDSRAVSRTFLDPRARYRYLGFSWRVPARKNPEASRCPEHKSVDRNASESHRSRTRIPRWLIFTGYGLRTEAYHTRAIRHMWYFNVNVAVSLYIADEHVILFEETKETINDHHTIPHRPRVAGEGRESQGWQRGKVCVPHFLSTWNARKKCRGTMLPFFVVVPMYHSPSHSIESIWSNRTPPPLQSVDN